MRFPMALLAVIALILGGCELTASQNRDPSRFFDDPRLVQLARASERGDQAEMSRLVAEGADINAIGKDGATVLFWHLAAASPPNIDGFVHLLDLGADPYANLLQRGRSTFFASTQYEDTRFLEAMLMRGADPNFVHPLEPAKPTAVHHAIFLDNHANLEMLLEYGADIEFENSEGRTPLLATRGLRWRSAFILLSNGADFTKTAGPNNHSIVWHIETVRYWPPQDGSIDWRQKVVDFLREQGVEVDPWTPSD